jgi:NCAIR mutase (PurE)-related protein
MGKVLRVLIVLILVIGAGALFLEVQISGMREALVGRTHKFEEGVKKIAGTIEAQSPVEMPARSLPERDISPVTAVEVPNPDRKTFWSGYPFQLEQDNLKPLDYNTDAMVKQLRQYYFEELDAAKGKPVRTRDPRDPRKYATSGKGTLQEALDNLFARAKAQNETLNTTRAQLRKTAEELVDLINEFNRLKQSSRADKKSLEERLAEITRLAGVVAEREATLGKLEVSIVDLETEEARLKAEIDKLKKTITGHETTITAQAKRIEKLEREGGTMITGNPESPSIPENLENQLTPGDKGKVVAYDDQLKFVVIELSPAFMRELLGEKLNQGLPQIEMMVRRSALKSAAGDFVTRIRLRQVVRGQGLVVADVLSDWQQHPLEKGDVVYF